MKYWKNKNLVTQIFYTMGRICGYYLPKEKRIKLVDLILKMQRESQKNKKPLPEDLQLFKLLVNDTKKLCQTSYERDFLNYLIDYWW